MKLCMFCLFLFVAVVVAAPRVRRRNVLTFLNDALGITAERTEAIASAAPQNNPVNEDDSEDLSEGRSTESLSTVGNTGAVEDTDSHEEVTYKDSDKSPLKKMVGSAEQMNINSGEAVTVGTRDAEPSPRKLVANSSVTQVNKSSDAVVNHCRISTVVRGAGFNGKLAAGESRELQDFDSLDLEDSASRPAQVTDHREETDYDGTPELSSERDPIAPPQHMSVPVKSQV